MSRIATTISSVLLTAGLLAGCGGDDESSSGAQSPETTISFAPSPTTEAQPAGDIVISGNAYTVPATVKPGQQLTVVNKDDSSHSLTADANNLFDIRISGGGGISTFTAPTAPGTYPFHCKYHAGMQGTLVVQ